MLKTIGFWLLPRSLGSALNEGTVELAKLASLPRLKPVTKGFVLVNLMSILCVMGWLYLSAPNRLCNNYPLNEQVLLGKTPAVDRDLFGRGSCVVYLFREIGAWQRTDDRRGQGSPQAS